MDSKREKYLKLWTKTKYINKKRNSPNINVRAVTTLPSLRGDAGIYARFVTGRMTDMISITLTRSPRQIMVSLYAREGVTLSG